MRVVPRFNSDHAGMLFFNAIVDRDLLASDVTSLSPSSDSSFPSEWPGEGQDHQCAVFFSYLKWEGANVSNTSSPLYAKTVSHREERRKDSLKVPRLSKGNNGKADQAAPDPEIQQGSWNNKSYLTKEQQ